MKGKSKIDLFIIEKVKEMRVEKGYSQAAIAAMLDVSSTFIGDIENAQKPHKYNISHLNKMATIFSCSPKDFLPQQPL